MASSTHTAAAADWYPDPADAAYERYWDGSDWTAYVRPVRRPGAKPHIASPESLERERPGNAFSAAAMVFGALAVLVLPLVLGPLGLISGIIGRIKGEPNATPAIVAAGIATLVGLMLAELVDIGVV